jgi:hypothetical protein
MDRIYWRAGNTARSRLSGGSGPIRTRPQKLLRRGSQTSLNRILLNICPSAIELRIGSNETIKSFLLPEWSVSTQENVGLVSCKSFERAQPSTGKHVRSNQKMHVVRHHDERMELIAVQLAVSVLQRVHNHLRNFRPAEEQWASGACVQEPVNRYERLARGNKCSRREHPVRGKTSVQTEGDEHGLVDYVPMGQPPYIMPHTPTWCFGDRETLAALSRLKAGCGQDCTPSNSVAKRDWWMVAG